MAWHITQITDTHLFADPNGLLRDLNTLDTFKSVWNLAKQEPADTLLFTGDLSHQDTPQSYQHLIQATLNCPQDIYYIPGNHDYRETMHESFAPSHWQCVSHIDRDNWRCIMLDSHWPGHIEGKLNDATLTQLQHQLTDWPGQCVIFLHHNAIEWNGTLSNMVDNAAEFIDVMQPHRDKIKAVFCGHVHADYDGIYKNIRFISTPSTCLQYRMTDKGVIIDDTQPGYRNILLQQDGKLSTEVVRI